MGRPEEAGIARTGRGDSSVGGCQTERESPAERKEKLGEGGREKVRKRT